jgi:hypothetical protein
VLAAEMTAAKLAFDEQTQALVIALGDAAHTTPATSPAPATHARVAELERSLAAARALAGPAAARVLAAVTATRGDLVGLRQDVMECQGQWWTDELGGRLSALHHAHAHAMHARADRSPASESVTTEESHRDGERWSGGRRLRDSSHLHSSSRSNAANWAHARAPPHPHQRSESELDVGRPHHQHDQASPSCAHTHEQQPPSSSHGGSTLSDGGLEVDGLLRRLRDATDARVTAECATRASRVVAEEHCTQLAECREELRRLRFEAEVSRSALVNENDLLQHRVNGLMAQLGSWMVDPPSVPPSNPGPRTHSHLQCGGGGATQGTDGGCTCGCGGGSTATALRGCTVGVTKDLRRDTIKALETQLCQAREQVLHSIANACRPRPVSKQQTTCIHTPPPVLPFVWIRCLLTNDPVCAWSVMEVVSLVPVRRTD